VIATTITTNSNVHGQTGKSVKSRFKVQIQAIKSNNMSSPKLAFAEQILQTNTFTKT
jgi:hypothetical protein